MLTLKTCRRQAVTLKRVRLSESSNPRKAFATVDGASLSLRLRLPMDWP
jgi:hypothetical protein